MTDMSCDDNEDPDLPEVDLSDSCAKAEVSNQMVPVTFGPEVCETEGHPEGIVPIKTCDGHIIKPVFRLIEAMNTRVWHSQSTEFGPWSYLLPV